MAAVCAEAVTAMPARETKRCCEQRSVLRVEHCDKWKDLPKISRHILNGGEAGRIAIQAQEKIRFGWPNPTELPIRRELRKRVTPLKLERIRVLSELPERCFVRTQRVGAVQTRTAEEGIRRQVGYCSTARIRPPCGRASGDLLH